MPHPASSTLSPFFIRVETIAVGKKSLRVNLLIKYEAHSLFISLKCEAKLINWLNEKCLKGIILRIKKTRNVLGDLSLRMSKIPSRIG
jgi:hypothetical protein